MDVATNPYTRGAAVPAAQPAPQRRRKTAPAERPHVIRKTRKQLHAETVRSRQRAIRIGIVVAVLFSLIAFQVYSYARLEALNHEIAATQNKISAVQSQNTRLKMNLNANVSLAKVDDYAKNELGMVKQKDYQVNYVKTHDSDRVLVSGGKTHSHSWH
ncbi:MAG: septum formation initiator family protein [Acutalibacteraceae bacterium]